MLDYRLKCPVVFFLLAFPLFRHHPLIVPHCFCPLLASILCPNCDNTHPVMRMSIFNNPESPLWSKEKNKPIVVQEGVSLVLPCRPPAGLPPPIIFWMDNSELIPVILIHLEFSWLNVGFVCNCCRYSAVCVLTIID